MAEIALLALALGSAGYSAYSAHETKQEQEAALNEQRDLAQKDLKENKRKIIAQQRASFLASGISLTSGLADVTMEETQVASQADANRISNYYDTKIDEAGGRARASYINAFSTAVKGVGGYYNAGVN